MEEITFKRFLYHSRYFIEEDDGEKIKDEFLYIRENEWLRRNQQFTLKPKLFKYHLEFPDEIDRRIAEEELKNCGIISSFILGFFTFMLGIFGLLMFESEIYLNKYFVSGVLLRLLVIGIGIAAYDSMSMFDMLMPFSGLIKAFMK